MSHRNINDNPMREITYNQVKFKQVRDEFTWSVIYALILTASVVILFGIFIELTKKELLGQLEMIVGFVALAFLAVAVCGRIFAALDKRHEFKRVATFRGYVRRMHEGVLDLTTFLEGDDFIATVNELDRRDDYLIKVKSKDPARHKDAEYLVTETRVKVISGMRFDAMLRHLQNVDKGRNLEEANLAIRDGFELRTVLFSDFESESPHHLEGD